jgi:hypothetical protein
MASSGSRQTSVPVSKATPPSFRWTLAAMAECRSFHAFVFFHERMEETEKKMIRRGLAVPRSEALLCLGLLGHVRNST